MDAEVRAGTFLVLRKAQHQDGVTAGQEAARYGSELARYNAFMVDDAAKESKNLRTTAEKALTECIGLQISESVELARRLNLELRIVQLRKDEWHTSDLRSNRVTVEVEHGLVRSARVE